MPFCSKCGTEVPENVQFCSKCGNALQGGQTSQVSNPAPVANTGVEKISLLGSLLGYFLICFTINYANCKGRARRKEFWGFVLFYSILSLIVTVLLPLLLSILLDFDERTIDIIFDRVGIYFGFFTAMPYIAVGIRRLNDVSASGIIIGLYVVSVLCETFSSPLLILLKLSTEAKTEVEMYLGIAQLVIFGVFLFWFCRAGVPGENKHGKNPKEVE